MPGKFVRVRDKATGHHYDLHEEDPRIREGAVTRLGHYDPADAPREPKHNEGLLAPADEASQNTEEA